MKRNVCPDENRWLEVTQEMIGLLGVLAVVALAAAVFQFMSWPAESLSNEGNAAALGKLAEVSQINFLIRRISEGKPEEAGQELSLKLAEDLAELRLTLPQAEAATRSFGNVICNRIVRTEKAHPEYYLANPRLAAAGGWSELDADAFKPAQ